MERRRLLAGACAGLLLAAGAVAVTRAPDGDVATLGVETAAGADLPLVESSTVPAPVPASALPTTLVPTTAPPSVAVPSATGVPVPPVPSVSLPPVPTVAVPPVPPVPPVSLPPVFEPPVDEPECEQDRGAAELPAADRTVDVSSEGGTAGGPFVAEGRVWFSVYGGDDPSHLVGVDPATGDRVRITAKPHTHVYDVVDNLAYTVEFNDQAVVYNVSTGAEVRRWNRDNFAYEGTGLAAAAVAADATGAWLLGIGSDDGMAVVARVRGSGEVEWATRLPGARVSSWSSARGSLFTEHAGYVYVGNVQDGRAEFWRVSPSGEVVARHRPDLTTTENADVQLAANASGVYAVVATGPNLNSEVLRLRHDDLTVTGSHPAHTVQHLFADERHVYTTGVWCSFLLSRYDAGTMKRTGFWRSDQSRQAYQGLVLGGRPWLLHTKGTGLRADALRRYSLG